MSYKKKVLLLIKYNIAGSKEPVDNWDQGALGPVIGKQSFWKHEINKHLIQQSFCHNDIVSPLSRASASYVLSAPQPSKFQTAVSTEH